MNEPIVLIIASNIRWQTKIKAALEIPLRYTLPKITRRPYR